MAPLRFAALCVVLSVLLSVTSARTFWVKNKCSYTVWPAIYTDKTASRVQPRAPTGWEAPPDSLWHFYVPDHWTAGRIWGRRDCDFSSNPGPNSCVSGGCNGGLECSLDYGTGVPPATLAEFTLNDAAGLDNYDVSLVDGFNIEMRIRSNRGCPSSDCSRDLTPDCPDKLKAGKAGCLSACAADLGDDPGNSPYCCSGKYNTPETCPASGIPFYDHFKSNCPHSYVFAYDEDSQTALYTCPSEKSSDYLIEFCP